MTDQIIFLAAVVSTTVGITSLLRQQRKAALFYFTAFGVGVILITIRAKWGVIWGLLSSIGSHIGVTGMWLFYHKLYFIYPALVILACGVLYYRRLANARGQVERQRQEEKEELQRKLKARKEELTALKSPGKEFPSWTPPSVSAVEWHNCELRSIEAQIEKPYVLSFRMVPRKDSDWRTGIIFFKPGDRHQPLTLFAVYSHLNEIVQNGNWTIRGFWKQPILKSELELGDPTVIKALTKWNGMMRIVFRENCVILCFDNLAWCLKEDDVDLGKLGDLSLIQWAEKGITQVHFQNVKVMPESPQEATLMDELCWTTRCIASPKPQFFEDEFRSGINDSWVIPPSIWQPKIDDRGVELLPHNEENGELFDYPEKQLLNVLLLEKIPCFTNGEIECEVYLEKHAIFNVMLRGSLTDGEFYMTRLDSRPQPTYRDCILYKPKGERWGTIPKEEWKHKSPFKRWVKMRVVANGPTVSLFRDGRLVYEVDNVYINPSMIGLFAEVKNVYVRKVRVEAR